jgi:transposase
VPVAPRSHRPSQRHDRQAGRPGGGDDGPFRPQRDLLATIPGIGPAAAAAIISEIGTSPAEFFTTGAYLASWAGLCPGNHESAGKRKHGKPRKGSQHLQPLLVECAWAAVRTNGRLKARYHRLVRCFGGYRNPAAKKRAIVAIAHTLAVVIWHMMAAGTPYTDLGPDFYITRTDPGKRPSGSSPNSKPSATRSPWPPPPETPGSRTPGSSVLHRVLPRHQLGPVSY